MRRMLAAAVCTMDLGLMRVRMLQGDLNHQGHVFTMLHNMAALQAFCKHIGSVRKRVSRPFHLLSTYSSQMGYHKRRPRRATIYFAIIVLLLRRVRTASASLQ